MPDNQMCRGSRLTMRERICQAIGYYAKRTTKDEHIVKALESFARKHAAHFERHRNIERTARHVSESTVIARDGKVSVTVLVPWEEWEAFRAACTTYYEESEDKQATGAQSQGGSDGN